METDDTLIPHNYQLELMKIAIQKNTIIFLPTGSGKTFIAVLVIKHLSGDLQKSYSAGGKLSFLVVNTVALVDQHTQGLRERTNLRVGCYTGDMNLDFWPKTKWYEEFDKHQVVVMTVQILLNLVGQNFLDLNKVNLLIFDECHRGVSDHSMRQLCKRFETLESPPRVLGLTATLLNGNCAPQKVKASVENLEVTYHAQVATVNGLESVMGYSTNPTEKIKEALTHTLNQVEQSVIKYLSELDTVLKNIQFKSSLTQNNSPVPKPGLKLIEKNENAKKLSNMITDLIYHIQELGSFGGTKAALSHLIQIERLRRHCDEAAQFKVLDFIHTSLGYIIYCLKQSMESYSDVDKIFKFSSDKVHQLISIFDEHKRLSKEELCCIIFTQRRFTAKVIYYILETLSKSCEKYSYIKPNFMVGHNSNPYNDTREILYNTKKNKQVLQSFRDKEINVLVSTNVLEEGVDVQKCTLVIKFDKPVDYRSYIQSKGRARHKSSFYYMIVDRYELTRFSGKYREFKVVENVVNDFLIGKNDERSEPDSAAIQEMYNEDEVAPYYVDGPHSAHVTMVSALPLLCQYCSSLSSDQYTMFVPELYIDKNSGSGTRVTISLPTLCPISDLIEGPCMPNLKSAKRAAALKACIMLHKLGELDDHLLPKKRVVPEQDVKFLFEHYPTVKENNAGEKKKKRLHKKQVPLCLRGTVNPETCVYLHIIDLQPHFQRKDHNIVSSTVYDVYTSPLCYGIITPNPLPQLCDFPIYVSQGTINVSIKLNAGTLTLTETQVNDIKEFHVLVFDSVLRVLKPFLMLNTSVDAETAMLVPVRKDTGTIDFEVLSKHKSLKTIYEPSEEEKKNLEVTQEGYLRKIVNPWYREAGNMIVVEVALNKNALSPFTNENFSTYVDYFRRKHNLIIVNPTQPLLLVTELTKKLIYTKPTGLQHKRKRQIMYEGSEIHLVPELAIKQEFPSSLWIQASFLPTILSRFTYLCQLEELRCKIASEAGLGKVCVPQKKPLALDEYLLNYEPNIEKEKNVVPVIYREDCTVVDGNTVVAHCNKDYTDKIIESEYPWKNVIEPKDIDRCLDVTIMDIEYYDAFVSQKMEESDYQLKNPILKKTEQFALTYYKDFVEKPIKLLQKYKTEESPELRDLYKALTTANANDIVNLERLETLGDSLLKYVASLFVAIRFPMFDEGRATILKGRLVSNKNLFYLAQKKNIGGIMKYKELVMQEWLPPCFKIPDVVQKSINDKKMALSSLFSIDIPIEEQVSGVLSSNTMSYILEEHSSPEDGDEGLMNNLAGFLNGQYIGDKQVADVIEGLLGAYFTSCGLGGCLQLIEWIGIIPPSEKIESLLNKQVPSPLIRSGVSQSDIDLHIPGWRNIEEILGYHFRNRAYLLQALTHPSYTQNRITHSYENLEFLGDAVLDFLITCYIYENCGNLSPGDLTDLRSALVNNNTFASLVVRCEFHKHILLMNMKLESHILRFAKYFASKNYEIDEEVLILLEEDDLNLAEYIDVPKVLGDIFEALAGAVFLDCGKDLNTVWKVFYRIMWKEIDAFSSNIPKNAIRSLYEHNPPLYPKFSDPSEVDSLKTMVPLNFMLDGHPKRVYGFGSNKKAAKKAAAKLALRSIM